jgi:radical SAM superfamily enzyme YgiQ (UPF0313 family)
MRVLIWKPGLNDGSQGEMPHIGMGIVAAEFAKTGARVQIIDEHFKQVPKHQLTSAISDCDIFACSLVSLEWAMPRTQAYISHAHSLGKKVLIGGPHAQGYWDLMLDDERIWKVVIGEVDGKIWETLIWNSAKIVKLGHAKELSTPDYSTMIGKRNIVAYPIYLSRGCTNLCSFCAAGRVHGRYRVRSIEQAIRELHDIPKLYPNVKRVYIVDDAFTGDIHHAKEFLRQYKTLNFVYHLQAVNVRADQVDSEFLSLLKECGADILPVGVESADPTVFKGIGKGETLDQIREGILEIQKSSLVPWLNMIVGLPYDNPERHANSVNWCIKIPEPKIVHWFQFAPFRGTKAFDILQRQGAIEDEFIPSPYGRRYDELPWEPDFETEDFTKWQRTVAQLEAYLKCGSPVPIVSKKAERVARQASLEHLWATWQETNKDKIEAYLKNYVPDKKKRGQL